MIRARILSAVAGVVMFVVVAQSAVAQLEEFVWNPANTGPQLWQVQANWTAPPFGPVNSVPYPYTIPTFPNDPGRVDSDSNATPGETTDLIVFPSVGANTSVALGGNLTLDVGATDVTVASLTLGGTAGAVTTNITSTGGKLRFENYELNDTSPVDPNPDICAFDCGAARITSGGVAGSTNLISAPVHINGERLEISSASTNNLTINANVTFANLAAPASASSIRSFMPAGTKLTISGNISLVDTVTAAAGQLVLNDPGTAPPVLPATGFTNVPATGTLEISGVISDTPLAAAPFGTLVIGTTSANVALGTVILSGPNTYRGQTTMNRAILVLANDSALGVDSTLGNDRAGGASFTNGNPSNQFGFNFMSDNDARTISVDARFAQWQTVTGEHSLTWAGLMTQSNTRGWVNLLPAGKTLTVTGVTYASSAATGAGPENRILTYDGTGTTIVTGGWRDRITGGVAVMDGSLGHFRKTGTGTLLVSDPGAVSDFTGDVIVDQGLVRFSSDAIFDQARVISSTGGAIGVDTGTFTNATLMSKLDTTDHGGLMLTAGEAAANIDFTSGGLANAVNMSVAAPQTGISYKGTIMPSTDSITGMPTYRLGGGNGVLTLPDAQLTGARDVLVTNGGEVQLNGANTYTGVTKVQAKYHTTTQNQAAANTTTNVSNVVYEGTTLTVNNLASGAASSIGGAPDAVSNVVVQGSTLKYVGGVASTNRLFTVGTGGATIDASGSGALTFNNGGALGMDVAEDRTGTYIDTGTNVNDGVTGGINTRTRLQLDRTDDLVIGMVISGLTLTNPLDPMAPPTTLPAGAAITSVNNAINNPLFTYPTNVTFNPAVGATFANYAGTGTVSFAGVARTLTLSGTNTGDNTLRSTIGDAAAATGTNTVNMVKTGAGKWILTGNNSYTGTTTVNAGTLLVNGTHSGAGAVTVAAGATLGGTGTLPGAVTNNGTINAGASVGTLTLNGGVTMGANSHWAVELLGATADKLAITGNLDLSALGNVLDVIDLGKTGTSWIIATYTGLLTGTIESITSGYSVDYGTLSNSQVTLNFAGGVAGDYNQNGIVDAADYVVWRNSVGPGSLPNEGGISPGAVDTADYNFWRSRFGATSGSGSAVGSAAVPEPATWLLGAVAGTAFVSVGRSRRRAS